MDAKEKLNVGIIGASGYVGAELFGILLQHPNVKIQFVTANSKAGKKMVDSYPQFRGLTELIFHTHEDIFNSTILTGIDLLFLALPHGHSQNFMKFLPEHVRVIDLGADYRIQNTDVFEKYYKQKHKDPKRLPNFVYGLSEINRNEIAQAKNVATPGCFATAIQLALIPLVNANIINGPIVVDAKTGSSGSGAAVKSTTQHAFRSSSFYAYKYLSHQHQAEIFPTLNRFGWCHDNNFALQVHSLPVVRGIFASCYAQIESAEQGKELHKIFKDFYCDSFFVRVLNDSPNISTVQNSNFADISVHCQGKQVVVFAAIDNLMKGAAGQAVQNMNLMLGWDETSGLLQVGGVP